MRWPQHRRETVPRHLGTSRSGSQIGASTSEMAALGHIRPRFSTVSTLSVLQSAQICRCESEQNAIRTQFYWPAVRIRPNGWLSVRRDCVLFRPRQAKLSRLLYRWQFRIFEQQYAASTVLTLFNDRSWEPPSPSSQLQLGASPHLVRQVTWPSLVPRLDRKSVV